MPATLGIECGGRRENKGMGQSAMRNFQLLFVAILVMAQLPLASAQELRKPHDNEIIISREYRDGRTGVTFYLNNQTDRLFCIYAAGKASGVHQNRNDSPVLLLPHE